MIDVTPDNLIFPEKCLLCDSTSFHQVTTTLRYPYNGAVFRCRKCDLVFLHPGMDPEREKAFYEQEYGDIFSLEKGTTPASLFEARLPEAQIYYEWVKKWIQPDSVCLEIGCASGYFLNIIQNKVEKVVGIESHHLLRSYCLDMGIETYMSVSECADMKFDMVFLFFVLEHIGDPLSYLSELGRVIKPGGSIIIVVPNVDDALLNLYNIQEINQFYYTPAHQFYYKKDTLELLFMKSHLWKEVSIIPVQRYDLSNHMYWMQERRPGGQGRYNNIFSQTLLEEYATCLKQHFLCDTLLLRADRRDDS